MKGFNFVSKSISAGLNRLIYKLLKHLGLTCKVYILTVLNREMHYVKQRLGHFAEVPVVILEAKRAWPYTNFPLITDQILLRQHIEK